MIDIGGKEYKQYCIGSDIFLEEGGIFSPESEQGYRAGLYANPQNGGRERESTGRKLNLLLQGRGGTRETIFKNKHLLTLHLTITSSFRERKKIELKGQNKKVR